MRKLHGNPKALVHNYTPSYEMVVEKPVTCCGSDTISSRALSPLWMGKEWEADGSGRAHSSKSALQRPPVMRNQPQFLRRRSFDIGCQGQEGAEKDARKDV